MTRAIVLGATTVELHPDGLTVTRFADGVTVPAVPHDTAEYLDRARAHGYDGDVAAMSRDHEVAHTVIAHVLTAGPSATLWRVGHGERCGPDDDVEEAAVMAIQRLARTRGIDLIAVAERLEAERMGRR